MIVFTKNNPDGFEFVHDGYEIRDGERGLAAARTPEGRSLRFLNRNNTDGPYPLTAERRMPVPGTRELSYPREILTSYKTHKYGLALSDSVAVVFTDSDLAAHEKLLTDAAQDAIYLGCLARVAYPYAVQLGELGYEVVFYGDDEFGSCEDDPQLVVGCAELADAIAEATALSHAYHQDADENEPPMGDKQCASCGYPSNEEDSDHCWACGERL